MKTARFVLVLIAFACSSPEARKAEVLHEATQARFRGDLIGAERILRRAHRLDPADPQLRLALAEIRVDRGRHRGVGDLLADLPPTDDVFELTLRARLWASLNRDHQALRIVRYLYRRGHGRDPEVIAIVADVAAHGWSTRRLGALVQEMITEGEHATVRAWAEVLPPDQRAKLIAGEDTSLP